MRYARHFLAHYNVSSNITRAIHFSMPPTLAHQPPYPRWHTNHVTLVAMSPTLACQPRTPKLARHSCYLATHGTIPPTLPSQTRQDATLATKPTLPPTPPTQASHPCHPHQHATHETHASMPLTTSMLACHPRKDDTYATHCSTSPMQARHLGHKSQIASIRKRLDIFRTVLNVQDGAFVKMFNMVL